MDRRILVAGIGNIFLGDDAFGVEVVRKLATCRVPPEVVLRDFGIRGFDLTYALLEDYEHAILVDAAPRGGAAGTLYVIEPCLEELKQEKPVGPSLDMHNMDPLRVMRLVRYLGGGLSGLTLVGCEPADLDSYDMEQGLSPAVAAAIEPAVSLVQRLIAEQLAGPRDNQPTATTQSRP